MSVVSWGRFLVVAVITTTLLLPVAPIVTPLVAPIEEPWRSVVIIVGAVAFYFLVDRAFVWMLNRLDRMRRPDRPEEPDR